MAEVDGERKPQGQPRTHQPRRLRDISHLYLSSRPAPVTPSVPSPRRRMHLGCIGAGGGRGQAEVCANMAVQLARLGQRTLILDLEPCLPNVGFLLGLEPAAYMTHLLDAGIRLERALLGVRVLQAGAAPAQAAFSDEQKREIEESDCVIVNLPSDAPRADAWLGALETSLGVPRRTTMVQAATRSPMFGTWLETSRRGEAGREASPAPAVAHVLDALLFVHDRAETGHLQGSMNRLTRWLPARRIRLVGWGEGAVPAGLQPWARIRPPRGAAAGWQLLSSLYPEQPAARTYQGLAQSLLAGAVSTGGVHV